MSLVRTERAGQSHCGCDHGVAEAMQVLLVPRGKPQRQGRGNVRQATSQTIAGRVLQLPMVDVHTVGAGGGSLVWRDRGGALRVVPQSAGATPGPACSSSTRATSAR